MRTKNGQKMTVNLLDKYLLEGYITNITQTTGGLMTNFFDIEHHKHGKGTAILVKHRLKKQNDLFMCSFGNRLEGRLFFCRKHIDDGDEVWWDDGKTRRVVHSRSKRDELEEALRGLFFGGDAPNM